MRIGVPKEIKVHEYRVGLVPGRGPRTDRVHGHEVMVRDAARRQVSASRDDAYRAPARAIAGNGARKSSPAPS